MATEYLDINLSFDIGENWCQAKISYDYEEGEDDCWDEPGWAASATNVIIEFRHPVPKGKPENAWAANPFLEELVDTEALRNWLVEAYESAAENYAYDRAAE